MEVVIAKDILKANDTIADANRVVLDKARVFMLNLLGSPGSGKTTLIEAIHRSLGDIHRIGVIEGDLATSRDSERLEALQIPTVQINTGGGCHLEAPMVSRALETLPLDEIDLLIVENVGNLVCTASHRLGERLRLVALSTTEGDDKIVKYPPMFQKTNAVAVTKADLLEHTDFSIERAREDLKKLNSNAVLHPVSARNDTGVDKLTNWLEQAIGEFKV